MKVKSLIILVLISIYGCSNGLLNGSGYQMRKKNLEVVEKIKHSHFGECPDATIEEVLSAVAEYTEWHGSFLEENAANCRVMLRYIDPVTLESKYLWLSIFFLYSDNKVRIRSIFEEQSNRWYKDEIGIKFVMDGIYSSYRTITGCK